MTVIIGLVDNNTVLMGGDSAAVCNDSLTVLATKKVFRKGDFLFGVAGTFRVSQILEHCFQIPPRLDSKSDMGYLVSEFATAFQNELATHMDVNDEQIQGWRILIGYRGNIYSLESNFQVIKADLDYYCVGSGEEYALGSLFSTKGLPISADTRVLEALKASAHFCTSVCPPFHVLRSYE